MKKSVLLFVALLWALPVVARNVAAVAIGGEDAGARRRDQADRALEVGDARGRLCLRRRHARHRPKTDLQVVGDEPRIRQAFANMKLIAESEGATLRDASRLVVYVTDMYRFRPIVNKIQEEFWGKGPYPPRTIIEVHRLNGDDICEVEGTFYAPVKK